LISVGEDSILNVYQIESGGSLKNVSKIDLANETYAIASNSVDKIAMGGEGNKVDIYTINEGEINNESFSAPFLAMQF
jgi:translation elongation factor P/translation initiation factor 5A